MGSAGKQLDKHAIAAAVVTTSASSWSIEEGASFPSPCPEDVFLDSSCPPASSEPNLCKNFPALGNPEAHLSASDASLKKFSVMGKAAVCAMTTSPAPCDYSSPTGNSTVHTLPTSLASQLGFAMLARDAPAHIALPPLISNHDFTASGNNSVHGMPRSTSNFSFGMSASEPSKRVFIQSYMKNLVPALKRIHSQGSSISLNEKVSAVKLAADMSLAISAGVDNTWSQALFQELAITSTSNSLPSSPLRKKKCVKSRDNFYARGGSIRRSHRRGGLHASALCDGDSHAANVGGGHNCMSTFKGSSFGFSARGCSCASLPGSAIGGSYASRFNDAHHRIKLNFSSCSGRISHLQAWRLASKRERRRQSGLSSYMKILRNSRSVRGVKASTDALNEAGRASSPSISKVHIESLGGLVPGGRNMDVPLLLQEAADYILSLQMQVEALESLSHLASL